ELRRQASGGDVIQIKTSVAFDGVLIEDLPGVSEVRQSAPREMLVIAEDAATTTPRVVEAIQAAGGTVVSSREYQPTFDEVFSQLVSRAEAEAESGSGHTAEEGEGEESDRENRDRTVARAA